MRRGRREREREGKRERERERERGREGERDGGEETKHIHSSHMQGLHLNIPFLHLFIELVVCDIVQLVVREFRGQYPVPLPYPATVGLVGLKQLQGGKGHTTIKTSMHMQLYYYTTNYTMIAHS